MSRFEVVVLCAAIAGCGSRGCEVEVVGSWQPIASPASVLAPRNRHIAIWTGSEMIVWGGHGPYGDRIDGSRSRPSP